MAELTSQCAEVSPPLVTVLALAYNHERWVIQALDAIACQTYPAIELIIVDDCSSDSTAVLIEGWLRTTGRDATFIKNPVNLGVGGARNVALGHARGAFVTTAAADDFYEKDRIERQLASFAAAGDDVAVVYGDLREVDEDGVAFPSSVQRWQRQTPPADEFWFETLLQSNFVPSPAAMSRTRVVKSLGGWDEQLVIDDWDLWLRISCCHRLVYVPGCVSNYRLTAGGLSRDPASAYRRSESTVRILMKWADDSERGRRAFIRAWKTAIRASIAYPAEELDLFKLLLDGSLSKPRRALVRVSMRRPCLRLAGRLLQRTRHLRSSLGDGCEP